MRRTLAALTALALLTTACGGDDDDGAEAATETTDADDAGGDGADVGSGADDDTEDGDTSGTNDETGEEPEATPPTNPDKPEVELPAEIPTALEVTVLQEGEGPQAETGDTVIVDYVGVRSEDGVEFDNSYDRFEPFPVVLGTGSVIQGWDQGLVGVRTGERVQLDIPSDLAYADEPPPGDVIRENEALTFVIDVRSVIKRSDPDDAPTEAGVPESTGATEVTSVDLVEGDGPTLEEGQTAVMHLVLFRGDNLVALDSTWTSEPIQIPMDERGFPGLVEGMPGMQVGGRRAITIPPEQGFGPDGNPTMGLPADTDVVIVVDLLGVY